MKSLNLEKDTVFMSTAELKEELHHYIDRGDKKLLHMMQALAKAYFEEDYTSPGNPMSLEDYKDRIRQAKANIAAGNFTTQEDLEKEMEQW
jgi:hypothetical protein